VSDLRADYDPIGVIVDWLDACRAADLKTLVALYDANATLECKCEGKTYHGASEIECYWQPKLSTQVKDGFVLDDIHPANDGIAVRYLGFEGKPLQIVFEFSEGGKIKSACGPLL
jgi:hypothetical protein